MNYRLITSKRSYIVGVVCSIIIGLLVSLLLSAALRASLGTPIPGEIAFLPVWIVVGTAFFFYGRFDIPFQMRAAGLTFGEVNGDIYEYGNQWVFRPFKDALIVPGPEQEFSVQMPSDSPEAKDKVEVIIGEKTPCILQVRVVDPILYAGAVNRDISLAGSFLNQVRLFVNQMNYAAGIIDEKSLLEDFIELRPMTAADPELDLVDDYLNLWMRLKKLNYKVLREDGGKRSAKVFDFTSVKTIMDQAGVFRMEAAAWGLEIANIFAPSIDLPEEIEAAARKKQAQQEESERISTKIDNIVAKAKKVKYELGVTGDDALDRIGLATDQKVSRQIYGIPGLREGLTEMGTIIAGAVAGRNGSGNRRNKRNRRNYQQNQKREGNNQ